MGGNILSATESEKSVLPKRLGVTNCMWQGIKSERSLKFSAAPYLQIDEFRRNWWDFCISLTMPPEKMFFVCIHIVCQIGRTCQANFKAL